MMTRVSSIVFCGLVLLAIPLSAEWTDVTCCVHDNGFTAGEDNAVAGPGEAYECVRPVSGPWTACFTLANHLANLRGQTIRVFSANVVGFHDYLATSGNAGKSSHIAFKLVLSEPVKEVQWDIGNHGRNISAGAKLAARYSADGSNWSDAYAYEPAPTGDFDPPVVTLSFPQPVAELYLGLFADVPEGETGWWNLGDTGTLTFTPVTGASPTPSESGAEAPAAAAWNSVFGHERVVPNTFFGTTTHVNNEFANRLLDDLGMRAVRIDFCYDGLEPAPGQYNFAPDMWMIKSADLGVEHGLDQLAALTRPPQWIQTEKGTFPNDENVKTFEEFVYQLATKYKGKIHYWQAMNEPNIGLWKERYVVFLKAFYNGIKRADPENKVVLCGLAGIAPEHLDAIYRLGGRDYFDILGAHPYTRPALPEDGDYIGKIKAMHDVMVKYGDNKPLWVSEVGWNGVEPSMLPYLRKTSGDHRNLSCSEEDQARGLVRVYLLSSMIPWIERVYFFHLHQEAPYTSVMEPADYYMGLFTPWIEGQVRPKDAFFAIKTLIQTIGDATFKERISTTPRIWALAYEKNDEAIVAAWSLDDGVTMTLNDASMVQSVTSMVGTPMLVDGNRVALSGRPVYLKAKAADRARLTEQIAAAQFAK